MTDIFQLNQAINEYLETSDYPDDSRNGLQVESSNIEVKKVALSVDAGLSVIEQATKNNADLLIVHHGLFWGQDQLVTGPFAKKIDLLLDKGCSLIAQHLPLDGNTEVGNNAVLAEMFNLENIQGFWPHGEDKFIGLQGTLKEPQGLDYFMNKAKELEGFSYSLELPFGPKENSKVAVVSGGGGSALEHAYEAKVDLFISGEPSQACFHKAKEYGLNACFYGHYATETVGVKALGKWLESKFDLETFFINEPTGI